MKTLRQLSVALVFTLALTIPALAGEIETGIAPPPAPAGEIQTTVAGQMDTMRAGEIHTTGAEPTVGDSVTAAALSVIQSVLALF